MNAIALIPARYAASRFPGKLMKPLGGVPVITRVYRNTVATGLFREVTVVTDSDEIEAEIRRAGGQVFRSTRAYESGSDRIAEAVAGTDADVILNVQGDTPFVRREQLSALLGEFSDPGVQVASLMQVLEGDEAIRNPNHVKVVVDGRRNSLLFSRSPIPYPRSTESPITYYKHIGIYAFRPAALVQFTRWPMTPLEAAEKIECLRYLEHGVPLRMVLTDFTSVEIDAPEDLDRAEAFLKTL